MASSVQTNRESDRELRQAVSALPSELYSAQTLPRVLGAPGMTVLFILVLFFITNVPTAVAGGPAGLTLWVIGGLFFFIPCALASAQLAVLFPYEGGLYNWTYHLMGRNWSGFVTMLAWLPGPLLVLATGDLFVSYVQNLNQKWLTEPWQQGLLLMGVILVSGLISRERLTVMKTLAYATVGFLLLACLLDVLSAWLWVQSGHPSATNFSRVLDWNPFTAGNIPLFGVITLGYLGVNLPFNFAGELRPAKTERARRHLITLPLLWGTVSVVVAYLAVTSAVLVVQGQNGANNLFAPVTIVDMTLGKAAGDLVTISLLFSLFVVTALYNTIFTRFMMVAGMDQRVWSAFGHLNRRNRVPAQSVTMQTVFALLLTVILFLVVPYIGVYQGKPADVATISYFIGVGTGTLLWAFATIFVFINIFVLLQKRNDQGEPKLLVPRPVLFVASLCGVITGVAAIVDTILNSYFPPLISNLNWTEFVSIFTLVLLVLAVCFGVFGVTEATWEKDQQDDRE